MKKNLLTFLFTAVVGISFNALAGEIKTKIYTPNAPAPIGTYSQAIKFEHTVYIAGQIAVDPKTSELVSGGFSDQLKQAFKNIAEIAKAADGNIDNVTKLTIYVTDLNNFTMINDVMKEYFHEPYPARAVIEIKALPKNALVEIEATMGV